jgi:hypothetical protein
MLRKFFYGLALLSMVFIASCEKDPANEDDITGKTKQEVFKMRTWRSISFTDSSSAGVEETYGPCEKDDTYQFTSNTAVTWKNNSVKCDPSDPTTDNLSWSMASADDNFVNLIGYKWYIEKMTGTEIVLRYYYETHQGDINTWRLTLVK